MAVIIVVENPMHLLIKTTTSARSYRLLKMAESHLTIVPSAVFMESHSFYVFFPATEILSGAKTALCCHWRRQLELRLI